MRLFLWTLIVLIAAIAFAPASIAAAELPSFAWTEILSETAVAVDWSPNGAFIVFANPDARQIALLNWYTRAVVWRTPVPEGVQVGFFSFSLRWSPDGKSIATVISGNLYRIDVQTGELHPLQIKNVSATESSDYQNPRWSPDSASIAVLNTEGFIEVFSASTGELVQTIDIQGKYHVSGFTYTGFDWSPDGLIFAAPRPVNTVHGGANAQQPKQLGFWDHALGI
ncbi:MAG: WD40 repeat domain-containing protein [Anaerolineae bacterium]